MTISCRSPAPVLQLLPATVLCTGVCTCALSCRLHRSLVQVCAADRSGSSKMRHPSALGCPPRSPVSCYQFSIYTNGHRNRLSGLLICLPDARSFITRLFHSLLQDVGVSACSMIYNSPCVHDFYLVLLKNIKKISEIYVSTFIYTIIDFSLA